MRATEAEYLVVLIHSCQLSSSLCLVCSVLSGKVLGNLFPVSRGFGHRSSMDKGDLPVLRVFQGSGAVEPVEVFVLHWEVGVGPLQCPVSQGRVSHVKPVWQWLRVTEKSDSNRRLSPAEGKCCKKNIKLPPHLIQHNDFIGPSSSVLSEGIQKGSFIPELTSSESYNSICVLFH